MTCICTCITAYICVDICNIIGILKSVIASSTRPCLKDLQNDITPYYAAQWTVIGAQLGIHSGILRGIQASYPADAFRCCDMMLEEWLGTDCNASWDKVFKAIQCPGVTKAIQHHNGMYKDTYAHTYGWVHNTLHEYCLLIMVYFIL